jgi:transcriptional regulator with XRE-family HTH domain
VHKAAPQPAADAESTAAINKGEWMARKRASKSDGPHFVDVHVGKRVHMRRKFLNISQEALGSAIDVSFQQVQKYERGTNRVSASMLWDIAKCLKIPIGYFYEGLGNDDAIEGFSESEPEQYAHTFLLTSEGIELAKNFPDIKDRKVRQHIVGLVRALADGKFGDDDT